LALGAEGTGLGLFTLTVLLLLLALAIGFLVPPEALIEPAARPLG